MNSTKCVVLRLAGLAGLVLAFAGCGGGGGGGSSTGTGGGTGVFTYFANFGSSGAGESEVVLITTASGTAAAPSQTVNAPSRAGTTQQATFTNLPAATLYVKATLYSGLKGGGQAVGSAQEAIDATQATTMTTDVGATPTSVSVTPATATVAQGKTVGLVAEALDGNNNAVFESSLPTWLTVPANSTIASVNSSGIVTGLAAGQATIQAAFGNLTGTGSVAVTGITKGTWTIMLFLNASNSLDFESYQVNMPQVQSIAGAANGPTRFVTQWKLSQNPDNSDPGGHPFNSTRRYLAVQGAGPYGEMVQDLGPNVDMGSATTLSQFVQWAETNYPADHYALVIWDHGNGWERAIPQRRLMRAISEDDATGNIIEVWQLGQALANTNLDIISFDACLMQMAEVGDEVANDAHYMVCSEDNTPGPGYPYNLSFGQFFTNPNGSTVSLAEGICNGSMTAYPLSSGNGPVSQSVVDLTKLPGLVTALNGFGQALVNAGSSIGSTVSGIRSPLENSTSSDQPYDSNDGYFYYDIGSIAQAFASVGGSVGTAASTLSAAEKAAVVYSVQNGGSPYSTGISFEFGNYPQFNPVASDYGNLKLATQAPEWPAFLNSPSLNPAP